MIPGLIDEPPGLSPLRRIAPSRYGQLKACALREVWTAANVTPLLSRNPSALLGNIAHKIIEEAGQGCFQNTLQVEERWQELTAIKNQELEQSWLENSLNSLDASARMYGVLKIRTLARANEMLSSSNKHAGGYISAGTKGGTGFELWVESNDKTVGGRIDAAQKSKDGIVLRDFKSGEVLERPEGIAAGQLGENHCIQLRLYAVLYFQTYNLWPVSLQVVPLTGAALEVSFTQEQCVNLLEEASDTLRVNNSIVLNGLTTAYYALANPSSENCKFCSYRPACPKYREGAEQSVKNSLPTDAFGQVLDINALRNGNINLRVSGRKGEKYTFRALNGRTRRHPAMQEIKRGDQVGIFNARPSADRSEFLETPTTVLYKFKSKA